MQFIINRETTPRIESDELLNAYCNFLSLGKLQQELHRMNFECTWSFFINMETTPRIESNELSNAPPNFLSIGELHPRIVSNELSDAPANFLSIGKLLMNGIERIPRSNASDYFSNGISQLHLHLSGEVAY